MHTTIINRPSEPVIDKPKVNNQLQEAPINKNEVLRELRAQKEKREISRYRRKEMRDLDPRRYTSRRAITPRTSRNVSSRYNKMDVGDSSIWRFGFITIPQAILATILVLILYLATTFSDGESSISKFVHEGMSKDIKYEEVVSGFDSYKTKIDNLLQFANSSKEN